MKVKAICCQDPRVIYNLTITSGNYRMLELCTTKRNHLWTPKNVTTTTFTFIRNPLDDNKIFYIGKGCGERIISHLNDPTESKKTQKIKEILNAGKEPLLEYLRDGLDEDTALRFEALAIDVIGVSNLTNVKARSKALEKISKA